MIKIEHDGSGREPTEEQQRVFDWLSQNWHRTDVFVLIAPPASGKSYIARAIQRATNGAVITVSRMLQEQFRTEYKKVNIFQGKQSYDTLKDYTVAVERALKGEQTVYNPISYWYFKSQRKAIDVRYKTLILDEADQHLSLLKTTIIKQFRLSKEDALRRWDEFMVIELIRQKIELLKERYNTKNRRYSIIIDNLQFLLDNLLSAQHRHAIYVDSRTTKDGLIHHYLTIEPVCLPTPVATKFLGPPSDGVKIVMMSATLFESDIKEFVGSRRYLVMELDSSIPIKNRTIWVDAAKTTMGYKKTDYDVLSNHIKDIIQSEPPCNTLVHATYESSKAFKEKLKIPGRKLIFHTKDNKQMKLTSFYKEGGILIGSGMTTGLDLYGDTCRMNIISQINYKNLGSQAVKKRMSLPDGKLWYLLEALRDVIQACGRGTRGAHDFSHTVITDPRFISLIAQIRSVEQKQNKVILPRFFIQAIKWQSFIHRRREK